MAATRPNPTPAANRSRSSIGNRLGMWLFATFFIVIAPLFPIFVEVVKTGTARPESYLMTAAVLSVGYGFWSRAPVFWALYELFLFGSVGFDCNPAAVPPDMGWPLMITGVADWLTHHFALSLMLAVTMLQASSDFYDTCSRTGRFQTGGKEVDMVLITFFLPLVAILGGIAGIIYSLIIIVLGTRAKRRARRALAALKDADQSFRELAKRFSQRRGPDAEIQEAAKIIAASLMKSSLSEGDLRLIAQGLHQPTRFSEQRFIADLLDA